MASYVKDKIQNASQRSCILQLFNVGINTGMHFANGLMLALVQLCFEHEYVRDCYLCPLL